MKPHGIDCSEVLERLPLLPGGDLESPLAEALQAHLESCDSCAAESVRLHSALTALRGEAGASQPPIDVWAGVRAGLVADGLLRAPTQPVASQPAQVAARAVPWRRVAGWCAAAAAALVCWGLWPAAVPQAPSTPGGDTLQPAALVQDVQPDPAGAALASGVEAAPAGALRRAPGEERRRDFSVPFDAPSDRNGAWSLAGDRELR